MPSISERSTLPLPLLAYKCYLIAVINILVKGPGYIMISNYSVEECCYQLTPSLRHQPPLDFLALHLLSTRGTSLLEQYSLLGQSPSFSHSTHCPPSHLSIISIISFLIYLIWNAKQYDNINNIFVLSEIQNYNLAVPHLYCRIVPA